ncbi:hypothetical protein [Sphingomonas sp. BAUL-RG-20F-R05-02]|uniref:hypothetical protein n=1 Tax=Sphingomonas sp. BAUL-RG-20F-R05-02 TaxID=2914830 RepID=UPI001F5AF3AB|nr:hypothetical protein [Sphingomonas sp. BAUL-RG-20F-R05-02]
MSTVYAPNVDQTALRAAIAAVLAAPPLCHSADPRDAQAYVASIRRLVRAPQHGEVDLGDCITAVATRMVCRTPQISEMFASVRAVNAEARLARAMSALVMELIRTIASQVQPARALIHLSCEWDGELTLAIASPDVIAFPVPRSSSAQSFSRASRLALALDGRLVRSAKNGMMEYGARFGWSEDVTIG